MKKTDKGKVSASEREGRASLSVMPAEPDREFSHEFVAALISVYPEAIAISDRNFNVLFHSKKVSEIISESEIQLIGRSVFETLLKVPDSDLPALKEKLNDIAGCEISIRSELPDNNTDAEVLISTLEGRYSGYYTFKIRPHQTGQSAYSTSPESRSEKAEVSSGEVSMAIGQKKIDSGVLFNIIEALTHPFYLIDISSGKIVISNSAARDFELSVKSSGCNMRHKPSFCAGDASDCIHAAVRSAGSPVRVEHTYEKLNGEKVIHEVFGYPMPDDKGRPWLIVQYSIDITERIKNETTLNEYRVITENLLKNIPGMAFRCLNDRHWTMEYVSPGCKRLLGYRAEELTGSGQIEFNSIILPDDRERVWEEIQTALKHHNFYRIEYHVVARNGRVKWVQESGQAIYSNTGELICIEGLISDISSQKISEAKLQRELAINQTIAAAGLDLLRGHARLPRLAQMIQSHLLKFTGSKLSYVITHDKSEKFRIYCYSEEGDDSEGLLVAPERLKESFFGQFIGLTGPEIRNEMSYKGALPCITRQTIDVYRLLFVPAVIDENSDAMIVLANSDSPYSHKSIVVVQRFINLFALASFRIQAEDALREAKLKAEESDRLKSLFLSNMSHDLRTPMNAIVGFAEMLQDAELGRDEKERFLDAIIKSGDSLLHLVNDIIDISKIEARQIQLVYSECEVNALLDEIELTFRQELDRLGKSHVMLYIQKGIPDSGFRIFTDAIRVKQILSNLIGNAIKFTDEGFIETGYRIDSGKLLFYVRDSGIGIPKEHQKLVFERFGQVKETAFRNISGTGLGLTISKNLVELLGGKIWLDSFPNEGSTFWFTLPLKKMQSGSAPQSAKSSGSLRPDLSDKCILVVEDVDTNYFYISSLLEKMNARVIRAANGRRAVEMCKTDSSINLVLMDIELPVLNGYEATREIKKHRPGLPVIAQTAFAMAGERERSEEAGCDEYLAKPIRKDDLIETITKFIS